MVNINITSKSDIDALKAALSKYGKAQLLDLQAKVIASKAAIQSVKLTITDNKESIQKMLTNSKLEQREAALSAKLEKSRTDAGNIIRIATSELTVAQRNQIGILMSSIDLSTDIDDELMSNALFELSRLRYAIHELDSLSDKYSKLVEYYDEVLAAITQSLSVLP